ncbi:Type-1A pilin [Serratia proteamaculans]|uniref:fimbrial protein n=1 Tax=Serratia proteamaculans TaxID=28151 RepID=UPI002178D033|nr:fimbrial protein [Serratia proteamaculans]CAI0940526.1 Type-1A pilin [Serratia proteamaculans]CAI1739386.1 Type-1A pilin [Serratia proteamaculans]
MSMNGRMMKINMTTKFIPFSVRKIAPIFTSFILMAGVNNNAIADCSLLRGTSVNMHLSLPGSLIIQRDTPLGSVIWASGKSTSTGTLDIQCSYGTAYGENSKYNTAQTLVSGYTDVYQTKVPGIGVRVRNEGTYSGWNPVPTSSNYVVNTTFWKYDESKYTFFKLELLYIGGDVSGQLSFASPLASLDINSINASQLYVDGNTSITKIACSLNSTSINVPLGDIFATKFTGIASTAGDKGFDLGLTCDKDARVNVSLAGTQNTDTAETSVLALTSAGQTGTASGVGVQLLYGGVPLKINNNILLKTAAGGQETLQFTARYYQTLADVGAGVANSSATLNITYQ